MRSAQLRISFRSGYFAIFALLAVAALTAGCRVAPTTPPEVSYVSTTIAGQITDESGAPLAGVAVTAGPAGNTMATTDVNGLFALHNVSTQQDHAFIIAQKSGYFNGARACLPNVNGVTYMSLSMASSAPIGTVNAATGGSVNLPAGGSVALAPGGVVTSSGAAYIGTVSVSAKHLDPTSVNFTSLFAGDLSGQSADGTAAELESYGVIIAELHGSNGEILQPATGKPATLTMPIAATMQSSAPATIPLWYFDETLGLWKEEGSATKQGANYVGTVNHFSSWNCDWRGAWGEVKGQIVCGGVPMPTVVVNLGAPGEQVITDGGGYFTAKVPADPARIQIAIQVIAADNHGIFFTNAPIPVTVPANGTVDMGQISLDSKCPNYLMGMLADCNNQPVGGMVLANYAGGMSYIYTPDGNFKIMAPGGAVVTLSATANTGDIAQPRTASAGLGGSVTSAPNLIACNSQASDIHLDISGTFSGKALAFSPDGSELAVGAANGTDVIILDVNTGSTLATIAAAFPAPHYGPQKVEFSANGNTIMTFATSYSGSAGLMNCWKSDGTSMMHGILGISVYSAVLNPDGASVFVSDPTNGAYKYDITSGATSAIYAVPGAIGTGNRLVATILGTTAGGAQLIVSSAGSIYVWDMNSNQAVSSFKISTSQKDSTGIVVGMLSADGNVLGLGSLTFYRVATGAAINSGTINGSYGGSYGIAPDDARFIAQYRAGVGNTVGLYNLTDGSPSYLFDAPATFGYSSGVAISPNGKLAAAVFGTTLRIWDVR